MFQLKIIKWWHHTNLRAKAYGALWCQWTFLFEPYISDFYFHPPTPPQSQLGKTIVYIDMAAFTDNYTKSHLLPDNNVVSEPFRRKIGSQLVAAEMSFITSEKLKKNCGKNFKKELKCAASLMIVS